jgi:ATP-dependent RNA helicase SUPV3L1/SUV3
VTASSKPHTPKHDLTALDALTGGAFTAATASERATRLNQWLASHPEHEQLQAVFTEMSHRDKGAAKLVREKLDEARKAKDQDALMQAWATTGEALRDADRINLADAMAWQRDAAKAGAPLSREPLASLKNALAERVKAIEELQHQAQVQREVAVLLAQRIEVLSTKPWQDALAQREGIQTDLDRWTAQAASLTADAQWPSVDAKFAPALQTSAQQVSAVWEAFCAALALTEVAAADASAPLPAVPAWADQIRSARGEGGAAAQTAATPTIAKSEVVGVDPTKKLKPTADKAVIDQQRTELAIQAEALFKPAPQAKPAEGVDPAQPPAEETVVWVPVMGGRKMQEALRNLREQWKKIDKQAAPNPALWKRFDTACNRAHEVVDAWLKEARAQTAANKAQRMALIEEVKAWAAEHASGPDWKNVARQLHQFAQRWRDAGHLSEKMFAEMQPVWKATIHAAHEPLEAAQKASLARRQALIAEAQALGAAPTLRIDAVKDLQHRWQEEAHTVVLDRKQEQKLWDAFRQPIDEAFARKSSARESSQAALTPHDKAVLDASKALEAAIAKGDAQQIRAAMQTLESVSRGEVVQAQAAKVVADAPAKDLAPVSQQTATPVAEQQSVEQVADGSSGVVASQEHSSEAAESDAPSSEVASSVATPSEAPAPKAPPRPVVAVRGDDRPGQKRTEVSQAGGRGRDGRDHRDNRDGRDNKGQRPNRDGRESFAPRGPRLGDAAFRAQRNALEQAQTALRRLAAQAHGEVLTQLMHAWEKRDAEQVPAAQAIGNKLSSSQRGQWVQSIAQSAQGDATTALLRLEVAADLPTPAAHIDARRALQLQLLTRRNDPAPAVTWATDAAQVLTTAYDEAASRRLQAVLKVLLKK